jgi:hypothetical protein
VSAWLDPQRAGFLHHGRLRFLAIAGHLSLAGLLLLVTPVPAWTPLIMAALVFHRYQRTTMELYIQALVTQDALKHKVVAQAAAAKLQARLAAEAARGSELPRDKRDKAG